MSEPLPSLPHKTFYYLRHGQTDWNLAGRWQGASDIPLNETGRTQAESVRALVEDVAPAVVCASPLSRAFETARIVNQTLQAPLLGINGLREVSVGDYEGMSLDQDDWYLAWRAGEKIAGLPETFAEFTARVHGGLSAALAHTGPVLVVAHGAVHRAVRTIFDHDRDRTIKNCGLIRYTPPSEGAAHWQRTDLN